MKSKLGLSIAWEVSEVLKVREIMKDLKSVKREQLRPREVEAACKKLEFFGLYCGEPSSGSFRLLRSKAREGSGGRISPDCGFRN